MSLTGHEKLMMIAQQIDTMDRVGACDFECPYCGGITSPNKTFCCPTMVHAVTTLLDAREQVGSAMEMYWQN